MATMTSTDKVDTDAILEKTRALRPLIESLADEQEQQRRMPEQLVDALHEARLFHLFVPKAYGGLQVDPMTYMRVVEEMSSIDGSAGWTLMIGAGAGQFAGFMQPGVAAEVYRDERAVVAGKVEPTGKAVAVDGGYQVTGRWTFGSGIHHATHVGGGCIVFDGDQPRPGTGGLPVVVRLALVPKSDCEILDEWHVSGLCGTGSETFTMTDVFVPEERTFLPFFDTPQQEGPLYRLPLTFLLAQVPLVPLGIARHALDILEELAATKVPMRMGAPVPLRERPRAQAEIARAEALLGSARAYLYESVEEMWDSLLRGDEATMMQRTKMRLATCNAAIASAQAVDIAYNLGGGTSIYKKSQLQRCFRDVHAATQHAAVAPDGMENTGRVLFGLDPAGPMF
ncbi:MAG: acyl-CoA dehydrogenase family protein [Dehalococcoidia bacterium]